MFQLKGESTCIPFKMSSSWHTMRMTVPCEYLDGSSLDTIGKIFDWNVGKWKQVANEGIDVHPNLSIPCASIPCASPWFVNINRELEIWKFRPIFLFFDYIWLGKDTKTEKLREIRFIFSEIRRLISDLNTLPKALWLILLLHFENFDSFLKQAWCTRLFDTIWKWETQDNMFQCRVIDISISGEIR